MGGNPPPPWALTTLPFPLGPRLRRLRDLFLTPEVLQGELWGGGARALDLTSCARSHPERGTSAQALWALAALWAPKRTLDHRQKSWLLVLALPPGEVTLRGPLLLSVPQCPSVKSIALL